MNSILRPPKLEQQTALTVCHRCRKPAGIFFK